MDNGNWKRWELALALALCFTLLHAFLFGSTGVAWWGVIFPGLTGDPAAVEASAAGAEGVELRLWVLDWLRSVFR